jgi:hypothetical protein
VVDSGRDVDVVVGIDEVVGAVEGSVEEVVVVAD